MVDGGIVCMVRFSFQLHRPDWMDLHLNSNMLLTCALRTDHIFEMRMITSKFCVLIDGQREMI